MWDCDPDRLIGDDKARQRLVELAIQHVGVSKCIDFRTLELLVHRTYLQELLFDLVGKIAAYRGEKTVTVKWPATWWDHLKDRVKQIWWLERALARLSVRYEKRTFRASLLLPACEIPPLGPRLKDSYRIIQEVREDWC